MSIGKNIKKRRNEIGLTQKQLAKMLGVSEPMISQYEKKETLKLDTVKKIAKALNVQYIDLLDDFPIEEIEQSFLSYADEIAKKRKIYDIDHRLQKIGYPISLTLDENVHTSTLNIDGKIIEITDEELIALEKDSDDYLKFKLLELIKSKETKK